MKRPTDTKLLGVGKLTIQKWTREVRLAGACVSGPNIHEQHTYIFNKENSCNGEKSS
ncbi:MAG TPA: hypothetical protein VEP90_01935 [Methylomirabilota bacterium]|nr:hypothetical protein [Methylomirabilota bacterium]